MEEEEKKLCSAIIKEISEAMSTKPATYRKDLDPSLWSPKVLEFDKRFLI